VVEQRGLLTQRDRMLRDRMLMAVPTVIRSVAPSTRIISPVRTFTVRSNGHSFS
jgi:hypothetical protein